ncbi:hypothetical protein C5167_026058 [Papaver somniferum]|uniref:phenylalanine N-monooxygenase-like n=1 Tax=Papaver somniferum TaxID=3469 RepID=UPI000E7026C3|nr:phenylalanine N-monooxygenase-like [Papaver somniferum]RZC93434.1 hypothetical protein C5167_026058 [Papaver somniferum]
MSSFLTLRCGAPDVATSGLISSIPTTELVFVISIFVFFLQTQSKRSSKTKSSSLPLPPGPAVSWPIIGNIPDLFHKKPAFRWIDKLMKDMNTDILSVRLGNVHIIPVTSPEIAREFLKKQDATFATRPITMGTEYSSRGFLSVAVAPLGDQWKKMRRVVASELMSPSRLRCLLEKRSEEADNLVRYIYNQCIDNSTTNYVGGVVNIRTVSRMYSGNVIRKLMFNMRYFGIGRKDGGPGVEEEEYVQALFNVLSLLYAFSVADFMPILRWLDLDGHEKLMKKASKIVNSYHDPVIDERIKQWRSADGDRFINKKQPHDLLDVLICLKDANGNPLLSTEEIKAQSADLIYASVDNPSNAVEWALAEMINQPEMLQKAAEEIDRVVGKDRLVQESDFPRLNYVKSCAREAFRLHPIAPFNLPHVAISDAVVAGYFIPKGSQVLLSRPGLGRNAKVWDEPLKFKPERHLDGSGEQVVELVENDLRFISFSTGRRGCMGVPLGTSMTVMLLARLLQGFS